MREIWFAALAALMLVWVPPAAAQPASPTGDAKSALMPADEERVLGKLDAPITIIEYASFTCPHCAHFSTDILPKLKEKWIDTGKARLVLRAFPRDEPDLRAAMLVQCAAPEKYYPLADLLFETQDKWAVDKDWRVALQRTALLAGISKTAFDACLGDRAGEDKLLQSRLTAAKQLGVESTPTFFINGKKFDGDPTVEALDRALSSAAEKS